MDFRENKSNKISDSQNICSVTGLPVQQFSEFTEVDFGTDYYKDTLTLIGKNIIVSKSQGNATLHSSYKQIEFVEKFVDKFIPADEQYVMLEDYSAFDGASTDAKNNYIDYHKNNNRVKSIIFFNTSIYMKIMIKIGKRLGQGAFPVEIVNDYKSAILLATGKIPSLKTDKLVNNSQNDLDSENFDTPIKDTDNLCPVSRLTVTVKPEWTDINLGEDYSVTFKLIGKRILLSIPAGNSGKNGMNNFFKEREKVLKSCGLFDNKYVEIKNYAQITGATSKEGRQQFINHMVKERAKSNLLGYFGFNATLFVKWVANIGTSLYRTTIPFQILDNYKIAIEKPILILEKEGLVEHGNRFSKDGWSLDFDDYSVSFELIGNDIIYTTAQGIFKEEYVRLFFKLFQKVLEESDLISKGYYYRIVNWEKVISVTWAAKTMYIKQSIELNKKIQCRFLALFGLNLFMKSIINTSRKFVPIKTQVINSYQEAIAIVEKEKYKKDSFESQQNQASHKSQINNLLAFMGEINWDSNGIELKKNQAVISDEFSPLYESISLIKQDFDNALNEKVEAEKKQKKISKKLELSNAELEKAVEKSNQMISESAMAYLELDQIFQASTEGMWVVTRSYEILRINTMFLNIINKTPEEINLKKCYEVFPTHLCHTKQCPIFKIFENNDIHIEQDIEVKTKKDSSNPFILSAYPYMNVRHEKIGAVVVLKDITERKKAEIYEAEKIKAEADNLSKSEFLANMSHEMRTPLNGIIGMTELIQNTNLEDNQKNIFDTIVNEAKALVGIINDVLDFSKIEAGKLKLENISFNLRHLIEDVSNNIAMRGQQKKLEIISFLSPNIPFRIFGDPGRLRQIIMNLSGNSLKFTHSGEIFIKVEVQNEYKDKLTIRFSVEDTGIGIPDNKQETIFNNFTQADGSTTRKYGGTGLGTAISKQLVQLMGGEIGLKSREGKGSIFWFTIDFFKVKDKQNFQEQKGMDLDNLNVLVVDQNKHSRYVQMKYLKSWGCHPVNAKDENEAMFFLEESILSKKSFDLIIIDFLLSGTTAFKLAEQIRNIESFKKIPIILLTTVGWIGDSKVCKKLKINGYLTKPIKWEDLEKTIKLVLGFSMDNEKQKSYELITKHTLIETKIKDVQILLVEDYPTNQQVALAHLNDAGYHVVLAENGKKAVSAFKLNHYDIILMDIQMPVMGGFEATKIIREIEAESKKAYDQNTSIIAMTAHAIGDYKKLCLDVGMNDYISKPLLKRDLLAIVNKWSSKHSENKKPAIGFNNIESTDRGNRENDLINNNPMNYDMALEEFMGKKEILADVLETFLQTARSQISILNKAIKNKDAEVIINEAHSIKGGAANLTANGLSAIAFELESVGKSGKFKTASDLMEKFEKEFSRLEDYLKDKIMGVI